MHSPLFMEKGPKSPCATSIWIKYHVRSSAMVAGMAGHLRIQRGGAFPKHAETVYSFGKRISRLRGLAPDCASDNECTSKGS